MLRVCQADDEIVRLGAFAAAIICASSHRRHKECCREPSGAIKTCPESHADLFAQTVLSGQRDVLAIDQHPALRDVIESQQQIDDGALAAPERPTKPIFSPRGYDVEILDHPARILVRGTIIEADVLEADVAAAHAQRNRIGTINHGAPARERVDAVLNGTNLFEQRSHFPHDPMRDAVEPQRMAVAAATAPTPTSLRVHNTARRPAVLAISPCSTNDSRSQPGHHAHLAIDGL